MSVAGDEYLLGGDIVTAINGRSLFLLPEQVALPLWMLRGLRYVPAAVLSAIILPELLLQQGLIDLSLGNDRMLAGIAAVLVAWRTRNVLLTVTIGLVLLWLLQAYSPF